MPSRSAALRRSAAGIWPVSSVGMSSGASWGPSIRAIERRCWPASTSVGAMSADCPPLSATWSIARSATSVLPEPTSPWTSRFIGQSPSRSCAIWSPTAIWSGVRSKGSDASKRSRSAPGDAAGRRQRADERPLLQERDLQHERLVHAQRGARLLDLVLEVGPVDPLDRGARVEQAVTRAESLGQRIRDRAEPVEHELDDLGELPAGDRARRGVDRDRQVGVRLGRETRRLLVVEQLVVGMRELLRAAVLPHLAREDARDGRARRSFTRQAWLKNVSERSPWPSLITTSSSDPLRFCMRRSFTRLTSATIVTGSPTGSEEIGVSSPRRA